jgi:meiotically up-regulated gene 157 (Mug157) protein
MDGGNGGIDAPVDFFGIFNDEEVDGIEQGLADDHIVNDTSVTVVVTDSKKEIVLVLKDVLKKMIQLLMKEGMSDNAPVNLLRNWFRTRNICFNSLDN